MTVELDDPKPQLGFKNIGTAQLSSTGKSIRLDLADCPRNVCFGCKHVPYIGREALVQLLHGHKKVVGIYVLVPVEQLDVDDSQK